MTRKAVENLKIDTRGIRSPHSVYNKIGRVLWSFVYITLFRPSPRVLNGWRRFLLRLFGAKIAKGAKILPSCKIWAPWNLEMDEWSCLSFDVDCYCVDKIKIGKCATVSQYCYLCTASHDIHDPYMKLITKPITIEDQAWLCADVYIAPGVTVGKGAVVGARSSVFKDILPWTINVGTPSKSVGERIVKTPDEN